jgi:hypothetical protein
MIRGGSEDTLLAQRRDAAGVAARVAALTNRAQHLEAIAIALDDEGGST